MDTDSSVVIAGGEEVSGSGRGYRGPFYIEGINGVRKNKI